MTAITIPPEAKPVAPDGAGARRLIALSDAYMASLYPPESCHAEDVLALLMPNVCFVGVEVAGELVACGAAKRMEDDRVYGEIKRVFVLPEHRGRGYARCIMQALETTLHERGISCVRLETGIHQPEALRLYAALGYRERGPFGRYRPDPLSVFMEKSLQ